MCHRQIQYQMGSTESFQLVLGQLSLPQIHRAAARPTQAVALYTAVLNEFIADWKAAQNVSGEHRGWLQLSEQNGELGEVATENNDSSVALGSP